MRRKFILTLVLFSFSCLVSSEIFAADQYAGYEECLLETMQKSADTMTVGEVRQACRSFLAREEKAGPEMSALSRRVADEAKAHRSLFSIIPHNPNYILFGSYNSSPNGEALGPDAGRVENTEVKFQVSFKVPLARNLLGKDNGHLYAAYTIKSFWQAYNSSISSPFRETNHEPEIFFVLKSGLHLFGWSNPYILAGFSHQSNGRSGGESRSWNRLYLDIILEKGDFALSIKPWYRLPESAKSYVGDPNGDDNPDIAKYLGYGELTGAWSKGRHTVSVMLRNNLRGSENRGSVELGWSFPLGESVPLKGYLQYFNGYGESLIDYNDSVNRIGFGVLLSDWL